MPREYQILVINTGSTSTKVASFHNEKEMICETVEHGAENLQPFDSVIAQKKYRQEHVIEFCKKNTISIPDLDAVVARGGLLRPIESGTYLVSIAMIQELEKARYGEHASNLAAILAAEIAAQAQCPAFIVDPVVVDEMIPLARLSGHPLLERKSIFHALNQKAAAREAAKVLNKSYSECRLIVVHLGGGISAAAHKNGRVVDVNNALDGDGPFSPERSGGVPFGDLIRLCCSGKYDEKSLRKMLVGQGGLVAYLGTNDLRDIHQRISQGDEKAELVFKAMVYQICKEIGALAVVLGGQIDAIVLTGGMAYDKQLIESLKQHTAWISQIIVYPGEFEMHALASGAYRVLTGEEEVRKYNTH